MFEGHCVDPDVTGKSIGGKYLCLEFKMRAARLEISPFTLYAGGTVFLLRRPW
jgi:hypothetical protein